jgi:hypothetical protein
MATPTNDTYSVATGGTMYVGRAAPATGIPAWVPPAGHFADVPMTNTPQSVTPAIYAGSGAMQDVIDHWDGSAWLRDFSELGAQCIWGAGHESAGGQPNIQTTLVCDFSSLTWYARNVPAAANASNTFPDPVGLAPDGTPYAGHTYLGIQEMPATWGGAQQGSLLSFFTAGSGLANYVNKMDVSQALHGYSRIVTSQPQNAQPTKISFAANGGAAGGVYPATTQDEANQGWWLNAMTGTISYLLFMSKTGAITQYPALGGNMQDGAMTLCESLGLLVAIDGGYSSGPNAGSAYRKLYIRKLATSAYTEATTIGTVPALTGGYDGNGLNYHRPSVLGLQWVASLGCMVGLDDTVTPPAVIKLTPPATAPETGQWTWSTTPVSHWSADSTGSATLRNCTNGVFSKFRYIPTLGAFVYIAASSVKPQVIKL